MWGCAGSKSRPVGKLSRAVAGRYISCGCLYLHATPSLHFTLVSIAQLYSEAISTKPYTALGESPSTDEPILPGLNLRRRKQHADRAFPTVHSLSSTDTDTMPGRVRSDSKRGSIPSMEASGNKLTDPTIIVVLGASGDLAKKKTFPAIFALYQQGLLPKGVKIVGYARTSECLHIRWLILRNGRSRILQAFDFRLRP